MTNLFLNLCVYILCSLLIPIVSALAIDEGTYLEIFPNVVEPFFDSNGVEGILKTKDGETIAYKYLEADESRASIVVLQGWSEHYGGYKEFSYDMNQQGISVYLFDWRGQGLSSRPTEDINRSHIEDYASYFIDLEKFMNDIVKPRAVEPIFVLSFSMGANILALYEVVHPNTFQGIIMVAPMLDIKTAPYPQWFSWTVASFFEFIGMGDRYVFGHGQYNEGKLKPIAAADHRRMTWRLLRRHHPETVISGVSWSWLRSSLEATWSMREGAHLLKSPILMLQAGKDEVVNTEGQDYVCEKAPSCLKIHYPTSRHAILAEQDAIRDQAFKEILMFIEKHK